MVKTSFFNQVIGILLLGFILFAFTPSNKINRFVFNVDYEKKVQVGDDVSFIFRVGDNVHRVKVYSDNKSLGTAMVESNKAVFRFLFSYPGVKQLKFVGISARHDTVNVSYGQIVVSGKTFDNNVTILERNNTGRNNKLSASIDDNLSRDRMLPSYQYSDNFTTSFKFPPTPNEDPILGTNQNVYTTAIGHPTADEARNFILDISQDAQYLSQKYQVPASIIIAMSALESGYGFSRNAIYANNFLGIKQWWGNPSNAYQLKGQPDEHQGKVGIIRVTDNGQYIYDEENRPDNWYKRFNSRRDCMTFLVEEIFMHKTGQWKRDYSDIPKFYRGQLEAGVEKYSAAYTFVYSIGEKGYSHKGGKYYADRVMKLVDKYNLIAYD
ncbi:MULTISPECIES: glucosaminidase domain-containing protein [unclassified Arcicella]|uniref:glucosaminidase domain-containing protein n=1 Tax=unclassified Arcicella TaxID=2644986 RepID=UPI00285BCDF8|nr:MULTISPECIES: glucosaminidase domain-containing protein [unclassified Arcicella]MDR6564783.1 flagellum-specific peptidoglycan hydrolase FlgJ [Arcicella sp. BE51]MDR6814579.1 flagellum-specific peptidoglycan hydrolase FlgJ [Arcicella sp. BE140]MDR6825957.1 flagellum-specific peptidoglycan hydrolase FlgJ [Arcicella sp. BE139]